jgi:hypothetical protein
MVYMDMFIVVFIDNILVTPRLQDRRT